MSEASRIPHEHEDSIIALYLAGATLEEAVVQFGYSPGTAINVLKRRGITKGFPDSSVELTTVFATEDEAVIEFTGRGTNTGPLHMPTGDIPPTSRYSELRFCSVSRAKSGKIVSIHSYYDVMTMLQQLGLVPAMGEQS